MRKLGTWAVLALGIAMGGTACKPGAAKPPEQIEVPATPTPSPTATTKPSPTPKPSPTAVPPPPPPPMIGRKDLDLARLYNGILVKSEFVPEQSESTAAVDRTKPGSYAVEIRLTVRVPKASQTVEEIAVNTPKLVPLLYGLPRMLETAQVSPAYDRLYANKLAWDRSKLTQLDELLTRHNFFDCDTILEMEFPDTGRKVILSQGDMDVNTDGSDGDRNVTVDDSSPSFQPQTSYRWNRLTERPNPFLEKAERKLREIKNDPTKATSAENLQNQIRELKRFSFLISDADPFIVLPGFMFREKTGAYAPKFGDYAIVIFENRLYPAIVGDAGPSFKWGEASMRLCRELDPKSSSNRRPVNSLQATYLVFPGTGEEATQPNLDRWYDRCAALLNEIGGSPVELHRWDNLVKPWPTPTPTPSPTPSPSPSPEGSPTSSSMETPSESPIFSPSPAPTPASPVTPAPTVTPQEVLASPPPSVN